MRTENTFASFYPIKSERQKFLKFGPKIKRSCTASLLYGNGMAAQVYRRSDARGYGKTFAAALHIVLACVDLSRLPCTSEKLIAGPAASTMSPCNQYLSWCEAFLRNIKKL